MGHKPDCRIDGILHDLMVTWGWGMYGDLSSLLANPPTTVDAFVNQLLIVDGQDPFLASRKDRNIARTIVVDWIFDPAGRGARSGLPIVPPSSSQ